MIKSAINKVLELAGIQTVDAHYGVYTNDTLRRIEEPKAEAFRVKNLSSLVEYIKDLARDGLVAEELYVHVIDPTRVEIFSKLNTDRMREVYIEAVPELPNVVIGHYIDREQFQVMLQSCFVETEHLQQLITFVSSMSTRAEASVKDDGTGQTVSTKVGVVLEERGKVPSPVKLAPFRTFTDLDAMPESEFIFRVDTDLSCKLVEADGGAWRNVAMKLIKEYLEDNINPSKVSEATSTAPLTNVKILF